MSMYKAWSKILFTALIKSIIVNCLKTPHSLNKQQRQISDKMGLKKCLWNLNMGMLHFITPSFNCSPLPSYLFLRPCNQRDLQRRKRIAGCKETCEAALQALLQAAAQITIHTTSIPKHTPWTHLHWSYHSWQHSLLPAVWQQHRHQPS